jgi:predicted RecA/RadA family phage recombinase
MKNFIKRGHTLNYLNSSGDTIASGSVVISGKFAGVAQDDILDGGVGPVLLEGVFSLPKATGFTISQGDQIYWNVTTGVTKIKTDTWIGTAFESALSGDLFASVKMLESGDAAPVAANVAAIKPTTPLTAIGATYADLPAARTSVNTLRTDVEARLGVNETAIDAITAALKAAGLMATS